MVGYRPETLIAEKTHAMVRHGLRNSRMKDYCDELVADKTKKAQWSSFVSNNV